MNEGSPWIEPNDNSYEEQCGAIWPDPANNHSTRLADRDCDDKALPVCQFKDGSEDWRIGRAGSKSSIVIAGWNCSYVTLIGTTVDGWQIGSALGVDLETCAEKCSQNPSCTGFVHDGSTCWCSAHTLQSQTPSFTNDSLEAQK